MSILYRTGTDAATLTGAHRLYHTVCAAPDDNTATPQCGYAQPRLRLQSASREISDRWFAGAGQHTVTAWDGDRLVGIASGTEGISRACGYLSFLCVQPGYRRRGIGAHLLELLENILTACPGVTKLEVVFHNPVHLPWFIPGTDGDWHPCLPGVDMGSGLYLLLKRRGWRDFAVQNAYHRRLAGYTDPPALAERRAALLAEGIGLTLYDPAMHRGLPELFENIRNPGWAAQVLAHTDRPIVVAVDNRAGGLVVSYTGPLSVDGTPGRGNFCGIGTRTDYRGRGIGTLVFCEMCHRHAAAGANFMSLYTGENNPARNIYEAAGFRIARTFADMRKEVQA